MRRPIERVTDAMERPSAELRITATNATPSQATHDAYLAEWPCLQTIEATQPPHTAHKPRMLTIAAWNLERCKRVEDSADLLRQAGADVVLATEVDWGMARSGQRHTTRDLAAELGFGYVFGVEFVELGTGDPYETNLFADMPNGAGLHGNAILSRYPLLAPRLIPLDDSGMWFTSAPKSDGQRRVGGRMAITAGIACDFGLLTCAAVHYESESDAVGRGTQTDTLLHALGNGPTVIGGDLNTNALTGQGTAQCLQAPDLFEPSFAALAAAGFDWRGANTGAPTTRTAPGRTGRDPLQRLDWLFCRGVRAHGAKVFPAISDSGHYLSDHELITTRVSA